MTTLDLQDGGQWGPHFERKLTTMAHYSWGSNFLYAIRHQVENVVFCDRPLPVLPSFAHYAYLHISMCAQFNYLPRVLVIIISN